MNLDFTAIAALVVVLVLFFVIFKLSKKLDFTLLVIVALAAGVAIGFIFHGHTSWITPIGKAYVSVLSALVSPLIIVAIISSITSLENTKQLKGIGFRYYNNILCHYVSTWLRTCFWSRQKCIPFN